MAAAPAPTPIPDPSSYAGADVLANNAYNAALTQINQNRLNTLTNYGYTGSIDPTTGTLSGIRVDPYAVHGQLQDLLHQQALEDMQARTGNEDRGVFGGLANQALNELHFQHGSQDTSLGTNLESALSDLQGQQQSAAETRDAALWQAEQNAADAATQNQEGETIDQLIQSLGYMPSSSSGGGSSKPSGGGTSTSKSGGVSGKPANPNNPDGPRRGYGNTRPPRPGAHARRQAINKIVRAHRGRR